MRAHRKRISLTLALAGSFAVACAGACAGCSKDAPTSTASPPHATSAASGRTTEIPVAVDSKGFTPSSVNVTHGTATTLVFKRTTDETCAKQVVFPDLKITKDLPLNEPVAIALPTTSPGVLTFQCGMGMYKSSVVVR